MLITLLVIGIFLVFFNIKAVNKDKESFNKTFKEAEKDVKDYKVELIALRKDFAETILELQKEIECLKQQLNNDYNKEIKEIDYFFDDTLSDKEPDNKYDNLEKKPVSNLDEEKVSEVNTEDEKNYPNNIKVKEIKELFSTGKTVDEIAVIMNIGKGEIQLIKDFYIK